MSLSSPYLLLITSSERHFKYTRTQSHLQCLLANAVNVHQLHNWTSLVVLQATSKLHHALLQGVLLQGKKSTRQQSLTDTDSDQLPNAGGSDAATTATHPPSSQQQNQDSIIPVESSSQDRFPAPSTSTPSLLQTDNATHPITRRPSTPIVQNSDDDDDDDFEPVKNCPTIAPISKTRKARGKQLKNNPSSTRHHSRKRSASRTYGTHNDNSLSNKRQTKSTIHPSPTLCH